MSSSRCTVPQAAQEVRWFVLRTRSRQEKLVASNLETRRVSHYLPLTKRVRYYGRRKCSVRLPLYPGYLFLHGSVDDAYSVDRTGRVAQIIHVADQARLEWEIENIQLALARDAPLTACGYVRDGVRAEVCSGPLRGLQGIVRRVGVRDRLVLQVDAFGGAAELEIEESLLVPVD